jgi:hypothetical protein
MRDQILDSIIEVREKKTNVPIDIIKKELKFESSKYSSTKENIWHLFINDIKIKKTSEYLISYKCLSCNQINIVGTTQFLRKIRQCKTECYQCNIIELKDKVEKKKLNLIEFYQNSIKEFESYPDQYTNSYFLSHLSNDDYLRIKKNIISLGNGKYSNIDDYEYWSIYKVNNQMKFSSILYDKTNDIIFKADQPIMKCDNCEKNWRCKSLESFKNCYKILCPDCKLCNRTFKIRSIKNNNNDILIYQSKLELKFINWCNSNNIIVKNGPNIDYKFNDKDRKYKVDFQINDILIEIKDFHIWHRNQVESGLLKAKENAVDNYIKENGTKKYFFITPNNWNQMLIELKNLIDN